MHTDFNYLFIYFFIFCFGCASSSKSLPYSPSIFLSTGVNPSLVLSQYLELRKSWTLAVGGSFEAPHSPSSPVLCARVCLTLPWPSQRWTSVHYYKRFLPAAQLCPYLCWLPASGTAQWKSAHPSRVSRDCTLGALCSNKTIRALVFALVNAIWKLHAENVPLSQIWLQ